jgi:hypothetical protein
MHGSRSKIPVKNLVRQRCAKGFNSGVKGLILPGSVFNLGEKYLSCDMRLRQWTAVFGSRHFEAMMVFILKGHGVTYTSMYPVKYTSILGQTTGVFIAWKCGMDWSATTTIFNHILRIRLCDELNTRKHVQTRANTCKHVHSVTMCKCLLFTFDGPH